MRANRETGRIAALQGERALDGQFDCLPAQHRESAGHPQADRAHIGIGRRAEAGGAAAENLGGGGELHVHFETDDGLIARNRTVAGSATEEDMVSFHYSYLPSLPCGLRPFWISRTKDCSAARSACCHFTTTK